MRGHIIVACGLLLGAVGPGRLHVERAHAAAPADEQRRLVEAGEAMDSARSLIARGEGKAAQKRLAEAAKLYREVLRGNAESRDAAVGLGAVLFLEKRYDEGAALLRPFHERLPDDADVTHQLGLHLYRAGEQTLAVPLLEAVAGDERRFDASWLLVQHYYRQANWQAGLVHAERYLRARPDDVEALALIGTYYLKAERFDQAIETLDRFLAKKPDNTAARVNRANAYFRKGDVDAAGREYEKLLAEQPDKSRFLYNLASVRIEQDRCEEALLLLERFLVNEPKNGPALYFRADCLLRLQRFEDAQRAFERAGVDGQSQNPWVWYGLSRVALQQGDLPLATQHAQKAVELGPAEGSLASWLGTIHRKAKRPGDALRWHDKALALEAKASFHAERGHDLWGLARPDEALQAFEAARSLDPTTQGVGLGIAATHTALAIADWEAGEVARAETHLVAALQADPGYVPARANLAVLRVAEARVAEAKKALDEAPAAHVDLDAARALVLLQEGGPDAADAAKAHVVKARAGGTGLGAVLARVEGQLAAKQGDWDGAAKAFEEAMKLAPSPTLEQARAQALLELGLERLGRGDVGGARDALGRAGRNAARLDAEDRQTLEFANTALGVLAAENPEAAAKALAGQLAGARFAGANWARVRDIGHGYVAYGWLRAGNSAEARKALERVRDRGALGPAYESILASADDVEARKAFAAGRFPEAERLWAAMLQRNPKGDPALANNLGAARFMAGKTAEAEALWRPLVDGGAPPEALYNLGNALARKDEHRASWDLFRRYGQTTGTQAERVRERAEVKARLFGFGGNAP